MGGGIDSTFRTGRWLTTAIVVACASVALTLAPRADATSIDPESATKTGKVRPEFISFGVDISQMTERGGGDQPFDFTRPRLLNLVKALAPAFIRYSGTKIEETYYDDTNLLGNEPPKQTPATDDRDPYGWVLSRDEWVAALDFADRAGLRVMASTSAGPGPRKPDNTWDPANAREMIERAISEGHPPEAVMLGNEPNITAYGSGLPADYPASSYARDVDDFLDLKNELLPDSTFVGPGPFFSTGAEKPLFNAPLGPDVEDIMAATGNAYDAVSYHQYPAFGDSAKCAGLTPRLPADTLADSFLDIPKGAYGYMKSLRNEHAPGKPLWIDESGNTACGGVSGYSDKFISTFYYLNSLSYLAQNGVEVVSRWTISGPQPYALIDDETLEPRADYWAALLWTRLMGEVALKPAVDSPDPKVRIYSQCLPGTTGGVTNLLLNTNRTEARTVSLEGPGAGTAKQFVVTGPLDGDDVSLNGAMLEPAVDGTPPILSGVPVQGGAVTVPAASYAFVTVPGAESVACGSPPKPIVDIAVKVKLTAPKQSLRRILRTGRIHATCRPDLASKCRVDASIPKGQLRRLGIKGKSPSNRIRFASTTVKVGKPKARPLTLKVGKRLRKGLRKAPKRFRPKIRLSALAYGKGIAFEGHDSLRLRLKR